MGQHERTEISVQAAGPATQEVVVRVGAQAVQAQEGILPSGVAEGGLLTAGSNSGAVAEAGHLDFDVDGTAGQDAFDKFAAAAPAEPDTLQISGRGAHAAPRGITALMLRRSGTGVREGHSTPGLSQRTQDRDFINGGFK